MGRQRTSLVDEWLEDDNLMLLACWARDGLTLTQIAERIGIHLDTFADWRREYPEIGKAVSRGKEIVDYMVENALLKRALGYKTKEVKVTIGKKNVGGEFYEVLKETTEKELAPDVTACLAWLNNKKFDVWKRNRDKVVEVTEEDTKLEITINRGNPKKDGLGENVNQSVTIKPKEDTSEDAQETPEGDKEAWPEDWQDEE